MVQNSRGMMQITKYDEGLIRRMIGKRDEAESPEEKDRLEQSIIDFVNNLFTEGYGDGYRKHMYEMRQLLGLSE